MTKVDITFAGSGQFSLAGRSFRNGDTFTFELSPFQTYSVDSEYDLTGTVVNSNQTVAVFSGMLNSTAVIAVDQLLPVERFGKEYIVAVDDNISPNHLHVVCENISTKITFNNGSTVTVNDNGVYHQTLSKNETFHFTSSNAVLTTLYRLNESDSAFVVVPPVSTYSRQQNFYMQENDTIRVIVHNSTNIRFWSPFVTVSWLEIPNTRYKVATLTSNFGHRHYAHRGDDFIGGIMYYQKNTVYTSGTSSANDNHILKAVKISYILPIEDIDYGGKNIFAVGEEAGLWEIHLKPSNETKIRRTLSSYPDYFHIDGRKRDNDAVVINVNREDINIFCDDNDGDHESFFQPLSTFALGNNYVITSCFEPYVNNSKLLIIAAHKPAVVTVSFRLANTSFSLNGKTYSNRDTITQTLAKYEMVVISSSSSLCGTKLFATHNVAVFSSHESMYSDSIHQLHPVTAFGQEYVVATAGHNRYISPLNVSENHLWIVSIYNDTRILFEDGTWISTGTQNVHRQTLLHNESMVFSTTKPVVTYLCTYCFRYSYRQRYSCVLIPPISHYIYETSIVIVEFTTLKILTLKTNEDVRVHKYDRYSSQPVNTTWENISNTKYKVGTCKIHGWYYHLSSVYIRSNVKFTVIGFLDENYGQIVFSAGMKDPKSLESSSKVTTQKAFENQSTELKQVQTATRGYNGTQPVSQTTAGTVNVEDTPKYVIVNEASPSATVIGVACGVVIVLLTVVITILLIYIYRLSRRIKSFPGKGRPPVENETSFTQLPEPISNTYSQLQLNSTEKQTENAYDTVTPATNAETDPQYVNVA